MSRLSRGPSSRTLTRPRLRFTASLLLCGATLGSAAACGSTAGSGGTGGVASAGAGTGPATSSGSGSGMGGLDLTSSSSGSTSSSGSSSGMSGGGGAGGMMPNLCVPDFDGDGITDEVEGKATNVDTDHDGTPDWKDLDSDGDSIPDAYEGQALNVGCMNPVDSDGDGKPDFQDTDSDNNGLPDRKEVYPDGSAYDANKAMPNPADTDLDGIPDYADVDNDNDSMLDAVELVNNTAFDSDGDGLPDLDDVDSDNDTIADMYEGLADPFATGLPAFRNLDSDGDGIPDKCEALPNHVLADVPPDTDNDGKFNFLDLDSDNDGLLDTNEDANHNCMLDADETDPYSADTDGDGVTDLVETILGSDPNSKIQTPATLGKYYFVLPMNAPAYPAKEVVPLKTTLNKADLAFVVDTSAGMTAALANLKVGIQTLITALRSPPPPQTPTIVDLAVAVGAHDDFPSGAYGASTDAPFYVSGATGYSSTATIENLQALQTLNIHDGVDPPQSQVAAYQRALSDETLDLQNGSVLFPTGAPSSTFGSLHFRSGSLPIIVGITNAPFHNGRWASDPSTLHAPYSFNGSPSLPTPTADTLVAEMQATGARYIGIDVSGKGRGATLEPYDDMAFLTDYAASTVPPSAFGGLCQTGPSGSAVANDGPPTPYDPAGTCRLIFNISQDGNGLSASVVSGVNALAKSIRLDVRIEATPDAGSLDPVEQFVQQIDVNFMGPPDPADPGHPCLSLDPVNQLKDHWQGPEGLVKVPDGVNETVAGVTPTQKVCFNVTPIPNTTVPEIGVAQVWTAKLHVLAKNGSAGQELAVGTPKEIVFIVPPATQ